MCADPQQQQSLVMAVREKVLENVTSAKKGRVTPEVASLKIVRPLASDGLFGACADLVACAAQCRFATPLDWIGLVAVNGRGVKEVGRKELHSDSVIAANESSRGERVLLLNVFVDCVPRSPLCSIARHEARQARH